MTAQMPGNGSLDESLVSMVRLIAFVFPDAPALTFVDYGTRPRGEATVLNYGDLDRRARAVAAMLQAECAAGDRVALLCPQGPEYVVAFLGCLYAGLPGVPLPGPDPFRSAARYRATLRDCDPACVLTTAAEMATVRGVLATELADAAPLVLAVDQVAPENAAYWREPALRADDLAYLQYTSGSTRKPAGVSLTHRNLVTGIRQLTEQSVGFGRESAVVSWLPYYHDMGLICGIAMPLAIGAHAVHLSSFAFVQQPFRWLSLISQHRADWTATPNFGYDLCVRRVSEAQKRTLDLSSLVTLANGSEQVRPESIERFQAAFDGCGLSPTVHSPGYGMAESTLGVASSVVGAVVRPFDRTELSIGRVRPCASDVAAARPMVSCGTPFPDVDLAIVDPERRIRCAPDAVGEIWVRGDNVAKGYWRQPELSEKVFGAHLADAIRPRPEESWLRTGDLGFLHEGDLYVVGRLKETILIDGRNHYSTDIETTVQEACQGVRAAGVAAFGVDVDGAERLVVAVEVKRSARGAEDSWRAELEQQARQAISVHHGIELHDLLTVSHGALPRTSSGKLRRGELRANYVRSRPAQMSRP
jgi:acyl-CoA synthetase (AMP-forming)/AMP-acid ligase II